MNSILREEVVSITNGVGNIVIEGLEPGIYNVTVIYHGNNTFEQSVVTKTLTLTKVILPTVNRSSTVIKTSTATTKTTSTNLQDPEINIDISNAENNGDNINIDITANSNVTANIDLKINIIDTKNLESEIINHKKGLIFKVDQTSDFVYPNEKYRYQIYCKNVSGDIIENVHIQIINPSTVAIDEDNEIPPEGINIGDLNNGQSQLIYVPARCSTTGDFVVHFLCYGEESGLFNETLSISCDYNSFNTETIHKIHIYNFSPYEDTYELLSKDYNRDVTQLIKKQKLPYGAKENPFKIISSDLNNNILADESENYLNQKNILYGDPVNTDEHTYQYLERENFNKNSVESFEGENLTDIFNNINKYSKLFRATFLRTGSNELLNDFREYNPDGFIYRFGLMNSEIFHYIGVIPEYTYMNDYLFRWASEGKSPLNLYPQRMDMNWDSNKWAGHGWNVWKTYTDEYRQQIENLSGYTPLFEFVYTFDNLETAQEYIKNEYKYDVSNEYYINTEEGLEKIRKYQYIIKESYFDSGVFFVNIPLNKIPSNFFLLETDEIEAIIEKTKPYGMKALIRYVIDTKFNINMGFKPYVKLCPNIPLDFNSSDKITYSIVPYKYNNIIERVCYKDENDNVLHENRASLKLIPDGTGYYNSFRLNLTPNIDFKVPNPTNKSDVEINTSMSNKSFECKDNNNLTLFSQIEELLYQGNFEAISFSIKNIVTTKVPEASHNIQFEKISGVNYQLWVDSLKGENNPHSCWWTKEELNDIDFFEIPLVNLQLTQEGNETGIGFEDLNGKLHGISAEYKGDLNEFLIKYTTSLNNNFKIKKQGISDLTGLAYKFIDTGVNTLVVFFIKKNESNGIHYHYFHHVIIDRIKSFFCFTRNDKDISSINKWSKLINIGKNTDSNIVFNTPQYNNFNVYDPNLTLLEEKTIWQNIHRLDRNEHSYAVAHNLEKDDIVTDSIMLHFDSINIPDDAVIKNVKLKTILESNSYKTIYPSIRLQDGFITENSNDNKIVLYPEEIECYPYYNNNTEYYKKQYQIAKTNDIKKSMDLFESKINENEMFNEYLEYTTDFLDDIDDYILITKPYWIELSTFTDYDILMNEVEEIKFCIEGYNEGKEIYLSSQLRYEDTFSQKTDTLIPSGYFKKYIPLKFYNKFSLDLTQLRFRFKDLNANLHLFDTYIEVSFSKKQNIIKEFEYQDSIDIGKKKIINIDFIDREFPAYLLKNGITTRLEFDDLESGEYYRIYSMELDITYQKQNIDFLANNNSYGIIDKKNNFTVVNGKNYNDYMCGMFFNELIMPGTYQSKSTLNSENQGIELEDALFQSFVATKDNITSITLFPNGFVGNPDVNLKIGLYDNKGNTPNRLIKEIRASGWSKVNKKLKNATIITYDFCVNNLTIGEQYWLKIEVDNPVKNNYYLLKYSDSRVGNLKLLMRSDNNLINTFGSLKFYINTLNNFRSFNSLPMSEDSQDFSDPKIFISLNKRIGEIEGIKVQKNSE